MSKPPLDKGEDADGNPSDEGPGFGTHRGHGNGQEALRSRRAELLRYAGLSSEVVAAVGLSVFLGVKADKWLKVSFPILSWVLPLLVIVVLLFNLIRAGSGKKNGK
jgi:putative F0F1-ATPase subunit (Ca2+/Mg2+ transporter)